MKTLVQSRFPSLYLFLALLLKSPVLAVDTLRKVNRVNRKTTRDIRFVCNICTFSGLALYLMLPARHFAKMGSSLLTENFVCPQCRSNQRTRALVEIVGEHLKGEGSKPLELLDLDDRWAGGEILSQFSRRVATTFDPSIPWGQTSPQGSRNEDLSHLTFDDRTFDVIISSEVHEHIEATWDAFSEAHRVLRPGGVYVFTLPYDPSSCTSIRLGYPTPSGNLWTNYVHNHGDPRSKRGIPAFWLFGADLIDRLMAIGFDVVIQQVTPPGSAPVPVTVFQARRTR